MVLKCHRAGYEGAAGGRESVAGIDTLRSLQQTAGSVEVRFRCWLTREMAHENGALSSLQTSCEQDTVA